MAEIVPEAKLQGLLVPPHAEMRCLRKYRPQ
jgi:hypothetical protein